jgi:hypothetical protein
MDVKVISVQTMCALHILPSRTYSMQCYDMYVHKLTARFQQIIEVTNHQRKVLYMSQHNISFRDVSIDISYPSIIVAYHQVL